MLGYSELAPGVYANYNGGNPYDHSDLSTFNPATDTYLNAGAFSAPSLFTLGNAPRYMTNVRAPWLKSEALSLRKTFSITERMKFELGADATNPFNIVRWGSPNTLLGTPAFGTITSTQGARQVQINMKVTF